MAEFYFLNTERGQGSEDDISKTCSITISALVKASLILLKSLTNGSNGFNDDEIFCTAQLRSNSKELRGACQQSTIEEPSSQLQHADSESRKASPINDIPSASTSTQSAQIPFRSSAAPAPQKKVSTKFGDVFAFSGPAPETINARLAMVGFVSAVAVELASGEDLVTRLTSGGLPWFGYSVVMLSIALLVPMFEGISAESESQPIFSTSAEMWNGSLAMIGLAALAVTEFVKRGPLV
ncbi:early light-induced protein 1, chloroplastic-like [Cryptomeria japonica]|uniref:early light-induced protein 1, chloroplastic-like n=1 Tax=Cryptomeria japonica TaxID=3369 RepID=UPI0027DA077E|nr:early light-induced protein 1, chloroplastic-like [Cryptomeria japonica]